MAQSYPILPSSLVEVQILGRLHGQRTRNVFHYYPVSSTGMDDGPAELEALLTSFQTSVLAKFLEASSNEWKVEYTTAQHIGQIRYRQRVRNQIGSGAIVGNSLPSYCAAVVSRFGPTASKKNQGRVYVAGVPAQVETDSKILSSALEPYEAIGLACTRRQDATTGPNLWAPTLKHDPLVVGDPAAQEVVDYLARDILRVQRRREFGVGE